MHAITECFSFVRMFCVLITCECFVFLWLNLCIAIEQGCAKVFTYDTIPFELSDMRQREGALPRFTTRFPSSAAYAAC
jgi:hypothetical protein